MSFIDSIMEATNKIRGMNEEIDEKVDVEGDRRSPPGQFQAEGESEPDTNEHTVSTKNLFGSQNVETPGDNITHKDRLKMKRDPVVRFASLLRKFSILGMGYGVKSDVTSEEKEGYEEAQNRKKFIEEALDEKYEGYFLEGLRKVLSCIDHGISISEKNWKVEDGNVYLEEIKTREKNLNTFEIKKDKHGNIEKISQSELPEEEIPREKLIILSYLEEGDSFTGVSDFESAWDAWYRKRAIKEFWSAFLELRSKINVIANVPDEDLSSELSGNVWEMLKNLQLGGRMIIPENVDVENMQMTKSDGNSFFKAIRYYDQQILKSSLMPPLVGEASAEQASIGSFALGEKHFSIFILGIKYLKNKLERKVNNEVIRPLIRYNFGGGYEPDFYLNVLRGSTANDRGTLLETLINLGVVDESEDWIRDYVGVPGETSKEEEEEEEAEEENSEEEKDVDEESQDMMEELMSLAEHEELKENLEGK